MNLQTIDTSYRYLRSERGIAYFEGGWWMHESDRAEMNRRGPGALRVDKETKQITIDRTSYPDAAAYREMRKNRYVGTDADGTPHN